MNLRTKLLLITILPVILISSAALMLISWQSEKLAREQGAVVDQMIRTSKQTELQNYLLLARSAIEPFYSSNWSNTPLAKEQVANVINKMTFGEDGYFFIYEENGTNLVHPRLPELVGKNWIDLEDPKGNRVIADLIDLAKTGEGFYEYVWNKPSTGNEEAKLGHSIFLDKWKWMMGTGLYLDDVSKQIASVQNSLDENVNQTRRVLLALSVGAVLLTGLLLTAVRISEQKLADSRLQQMANQVVRAQENERKRVSTELHDGISQLLVSARYGLDLARSNAGKNRKVIEPVDKSMEAIATAISEIRRISMALRPSVLDDMGLAPAIKSLGADFQCQTQINVEIDATGFAGNPGDMEKTTLYRVAQEALTNVAKHSNASTVWIALNTRGKKTELEISDNGTGLKFNFKTGGAGLGLGNMRERLEGHGGQLTLSQAKQGGLRIKASLTTAAPDPVGDRLKEAA